MLEFLTMTPAGCHRVFTRHLLHRLAALAVSVGAVLLTLAIHQEANAEPATRPNIVLIMADDMGYECVSSNGGESYQTPRLDALAQSGIRFNHCHSQPICTPTRVQIMTGLYNNRNYVRFGLLDPQATTFGHLMKQAGYATCIVGKWQLSGGFEAPAHFGFDEYCLWQLNRRPSRYVNPGLEINGKQVDYTKGEYGPDIVSDYLCDFVERHKDEPFFAYYPMILPHWPFEPTPDHADYDKTAKGKPGTGENKYFPAMVSYVDKLVGKVVDKLEALGIRNNTLVIFTGDNGTYTGITSTLNGKPYQGGKGSTRDNGTHVPLIVSWPGVAKAGQVTDSLVDFTDMVPTVVETGSGKLPTEIPLKGVSLVPFLRGEQEHGRTSVYCWYERNGLRAKASQHMRDRRYKLYSDGNFYDVQQDFAEKKPLEVGSLAPEVAAIHAKLKSELEAQLTITAEADAAMKGKKNQKKPKKQQD